MKDRNIDTSNQSTEAWAVADAKARLSEVLRRAREQGPQRIGTREPCIVVAEEDWLRLNGDKPKLGQWLVQTLQGVGELELPSRADPPRPVPFEDGTQSCI